MTINYRNFSTKKNAGIFLNEKTIFGFIGSNVLFLTKIKFARIFVKIIIMESFLKKAFSLNFQLLSTVLLLPSCKKKPSTVLYEKKMRSILFNLQALGRICRFVYDKKTFKELIEVFKCMEDGLGKMDYYDSFFNQFSGDKSLPKSFINYFSEKRDEENAKLDIIINQNNFCSPEFFKNIEQTLVNVNWLDSDAERTSFINFLIKQIDSICEDLDAGVLNFRNVETGLHEIRRKVRWISIYSAVSDGIVQLKKTAAPNNLLKHYLTPEIINLPFNKLPKSQKGIPPVYIQSQNFYALSWLINELGKLKDEGLKRMAVQDAIKGMESANNKLRDYLLKDVRSLNSICDEAENVVDDFVYNNGVLERIKRDLNRSKVN